MRLSERLKSLRKEKGMTQQETADKLFVSRSLYAKFENDISRPDADILDRISSLYDVPVSELIPDERKALSKFTSMKTLIIMAFVYCLIFAFFYFLPFFKVYHYEYPAPVGGQPERVFEMMSPFMISRNHNIHIGTIAVVLSLFEIVFDAIIYLFQKISCVKVLFVISMIIAVVVLVLSFVVVAYSCGYSF